ncbi:MAG: class I SAM-dependent RNA methyltransferase [Bacteroidota bacterium]
MKSAECYRDYNELSAHWSVDPPMFEEQLQSAVLSSSLPHRILSPGECQSERNQKCRLCLAADITYEQETRVKTQALQKFWREHFPDVSLQPLVPSPMGRGYRTVTKRKAFRRLTGTTLGLIDPAESREGGSFTVVRCVIEPEGHTAIYEMISNALTSPHTKPFAEKLNYVVIKGNYTEFSIIFNVEKITPLLVTTANTISKSLTRKFDSITGVFLYEDDSDGRYYLGANSDRQTLRKLFGKPDIFQRILGRGFLFSPLAFSQINLALVDELAMKAIELLQPHNDCTMYDLYCGHGLFGLLVAEKVKSVVGIEMSASAVQSAIANARRQRISNARFLRNDLTEESVQVSLKKLTRDDIVLLDPPRNGVADGVVEYVAAKRPARVLHLFCNIDLMPKEIKRWTDNGYAIAAAVPFDMFPGTSTMEVLVLFQPS